MLELLARQADHGVDQRRATWVLHRESQRAARDLALIGSMVLEKGDEILTHRVDPSAGAGAAQPKHGPSLTAARCDVEGDGRALFRGSSGCEKSRRVHNRIMNATAGLALDDRQGVAGQRQSAVPGLRDTLDRLRYRAQHYGLTLSLAIPGRLLNFV